MGTLVVKDEFSRTRISFSSFVRFLPSATKEYQMANMSTLRRLSQTSATPTPPRRATIWVAAVVAC
jgi:hypothetical protein